MTSTYTSFYQFYAGYSNQSNNTPVQNNNASVQNNNTFAQNNYASVDESSFYISNSPKYYYNRQFYGQYSYEQPPVSSYEQSPVNSNTLSFNIGNLFDLFNEANIFNSLNKLSSIASIISSKIKTTFDANGNRIKTHYDSNNQKCFDSICDSNGKHIKDVFYKDGKVSKTIVYDEQGAIQTITNKIYNSDGTIKEVVKNADGEKIQDSLYDSNEKLTKSTIYNSDGTTLSSTYDLKGRKVQADSFNKDGKLTISTLYNEDGTRSETVFDVDGKKIQDSQYGKDGKLRHYDTYKDGVLNQKTDRVNNADGTAVDTIYDEDGNIFKDNYLDKNGNITSTKDVLYRKGDGGYGMIDWNNDGKFGNDGGYSGYIAIHGDIDKFFTGMGYYFQTPDIEKVLKNVDNTAKDKNSATGDVSNGTVTLHKISDTQFGMNVTAHDMSTSAGFQYDYFVWDKTKNTYTVGMDNNKDGNLTGDEISAIVQNAGNKMSSPLTFDLNGDGVKTSEKLTQFDINGDGKLDAINDVADGTLSIRGGNSGKDLFGDNTDLDGDGKADGYANGFDALKALATKEGLINRNDDMVLDLKDIKTLEDKYQFGMKTGGYNSKAKSLADLGITEINIGEKDNVEKTYNFDGRNNMLMTQAGATFTVNGKKRDYADIWHSLTA